MADVELLVADAADLALGSFLAPPWGVYLAGVPVIQPASVLGAVATAALAPVAAIASLLGAPNILPVTASTVEFEFAQDWPISNYPQEQGAFQSYDKVTLPFDVKLRLASGGSASARQAFLTSCLSIANSLALFDVVTPEITFTSCSVTHIGWPRRASSGVSLIQVELWFQQVNVAAGVNFTNTQQPGNAGQQSLSNVQPTTLNQQAQQAFDTFGAN